MITGRDVKKLKKVKSSHSNIEYIECNILDRNKVKAIVENLEDIDVLINYVGVINTEEEKINLDIETLDTVLDINLKGTIILSLLVIQKMISKSIKGKIINIGSIVGNNGSKYFPIYSASKGGVISFTKSIASRYGENGIRCNVISPGVIQTPMSYVETPDFDIYIPDIQNKTPLRKLGLPNDIATVALFLASEESSFVTGQEIVVDGGYTLSQE